MCKVSKSWFKKHGFEETVYEDVHEYHNYRQEVTKKKQIIYELCFKDKYVRFDSYYSVKTNKFNDKKISRYYIVSAYNYKTNFRIENTITHYLPTVEQMEAILKIVGITF